MSNQQESIRQILVGGGDPQSDQALTGNAPVTGAPTGDRKELTGFDCLSANGEKPQFVQNSFFLDFASPSKNKNSNKEFFSTRQKKSLETMELNLSDLQELANTSRRGRKPRFVMTPVRQGRLFDSPRSNQIDHEPELFLQQVKLAGNEFDNHDDLQVNNDLDEFRHELTLAAKRSKKKEYKKNEKNSFEQCPVFQRMFEGLREETLDQCMTRMARVPTCMQYSRTINGSEKPDLKKTINEMIKSSNPWPQSKTSPSVILDIFCTDDSLVTVQARHKLVNALDPVFYRVKNRTYEYCPRCWSGSTTQQVAHKLDCLDKATWQYQRIFSLNRTEYPCLLCLDCFMHKETLALHLLGHNIDEVKWLGQHP